MDTVDLSNYLDPQRKGYLLPRTLLTSKEFAEASRLGLKNYKGISLGLISPMPDPLSTKALRLTAPAELRDALTQAEANYRNAETVCESSHSLFQQAMTERATFSRQVGDGPLTDRGNERLRELTRELESTEKAYRDSKDLETEARIARLHAARALDNWCRGESLRRTQAAEQAAAEAKRPKPAPLSERLSKLGKKIAGK